MDCLLQWDEWNGILSTFTFISAIPHFPPAMIFREIQFLPYHLLHNINVHRKWEEINPRSMFNMIKIARLKVNQQQYPFKLQGEFFSSTSKWVSERESKRLKLKVNLVHIAESVYMTSCYGDYSHFIVGNC